MLILIDRINDRGSVKVILTVNTVYIFVLEADQEISIQEANMMCF